MNNFFPFQTGSIHYCDKGSGKTIILLHGYLESSDIWSGFAAQLANRFRVITVDLPGHGLSDVFGGCHTMEFMATGIKELIDNLNINKVFLTGHSLGGYIALAFIELFPERLTGYCLFHSHPFADSPEALEKREREIKLVKGGKVDLMYPDNVAKMFATENLEKFKDALHISKEIASKIPGEGIIAVLKGMMARPSRLLFMEEGRVPCLWILGRMDNYISCEVVQKKVKLPANAKVVILENSGHLGFIEEEDRAIEVMVNFVEGLK